MQLSTRLSWTAFAVSVLMSVLAEAAPGMTSVTEYSVIEPGVVGSIRENLDAQSKPELRLSVEGRDGPLTLVLEDNERLLGRVPASRREVLRDAGNRFLSGTVKGRPGSWARVNWIDGRVSGLIFDGDELLLLDQAEGFSTARGPATDPGATVLLRYADLDTGLLFDHGGQMLNAPGGDELKKTPGDYGSFVQDLRQSVQADGMTLLDMPVTVVVDTQFQDRHGTDSEAIVVGRINFVDGIYANQLGVGIVLWHYEPLADNGPLTSTDPSTLLTSQFREFMRSGDGSDIPFRGLAHLFTRRDLDGNTVGFAYINTLCSPFAGYGINQDLNSSTTSALVFAHELGHNYSANHTDEGIMRATIGGSQEFAPESVAVMTDALSRAQCLVNGELRIFSDDFE
ncbi:MAG: M12 family metallo-peptidase [Xanthomonadales bacterium]|jgi:hypothetical protein|nr:M12 family metallo-peptidase [Xanthomonadales bacterium]